MAALPNTITIGDPDAPLFVFHNKEEGTNRDGIGSVGGVFAVDVVGDELSIDTVTAIVQVGRPALPVSVTRELYLSPDGGVYISPGDTFYYTEHTVEGGGGQTGDVAAIPYGTPFRWECNGRLIASFYCLQPVRIGRWTWEITAVSGVGLLDKLDHKGGLYNGEAFAEVVTDVIGGAFPFTVAPALAEQAVYGWLPYATRRANLHRLLLALGASMRRDANGEVAFVFLSVDGPMEVTDDRIDVNGSVDYDAPATRAEVTEHAFFVSPSTEAETLFDNTQAGGAAESTPVRFNGPMYDLTASDSLTIEESGVNYAVVTGVGTLEGKAYAHVTRIVGADAPSPSGVENVKHLRDDFTLISLANSSNVARRALAYYSGARLVQARIKLLGERCGDVLSMSDPFYDPITAFVQSLDVNASSNLLGYATLVENYTPRYQGNNISMFEILTEGTSWTAPADIQPGTEITVIVIGGGDGGMDGEDGLSGGSSNDWAQFEPTERNSVEISAKEGADGGAGGKAGEGGKIMRGTMIVNPSQVISMQIGAGGEANGGAGGETVFGDISSSSGASSAGGFVNPISGTIYAQPGTDGAAGGKGGKGGGAGSNGSPGQDVGEFIGGDGGTGYTSVRQLDAVYIGGGGGSGANASSNGLRGESGTFRTEASNTRGYLTSAGAEGVPGRDGEPTSQPGSGGNGGDGGSGGGGHGAARYTKTGTMSGWVSAYLVGKGGVGGAGGKGSAGAPGCVILFRGG